MATRITTDLEAVLYDNDTGNLLYVLSAMTDGRRIKVVVTPDFWHKKQQASLNSTRSAFKIDVNALIDSRKYTVVQGKVKD